MVSSISGNEHLTYLKTRMNQAKTVREEDRVIRDSEYAEKIQAGNNKDLAVTRKNEASDIRDNADAKKTEATEIAKNAQEVKDTKAQEREDATNARKDAEQNVEDKTKAQSDAFTKVQTAQSELAGAQQALAAAQAAATEENPNTAAIAAAQAAVRAAQEHLKEAQEELLKATEELGIAKQELADAKVKESDAIAADEQADIDLQEANTAKDIADKEFEVADKDFNEAERVLTEAETVYNKENSEYEIAETNYKASCEAYEDAREAYIQAVEELIGESLDGAVGEDEGYQEPEAASQGGCGSCAQGFDEPQETQSAASSEATQSAQSAQPATSSETAQPAAAPVGGTEAGATTQVASAQGEAVGAAAGTNNIGEASSQKSKMEQMTDYYKGEAHNAIKEQFGLFSNQELPKVDDKTYASLNEKAKSGGYDNLSKEEQLALVTYEVDKTIDEKFAKAENVEKFAMKDDQGRNLYTTPNGTSLVKGEDGKFYHADGSGEYQGIADVSLQLGVHKTDENGNKLYTDQNGNTVTRFVDEDGKVSYKNADGSDFDAKTGALKMQLEKYDSTAAECALARDLNQILVDLKDGKFPAAAQEKPEVSENMEISDNLSADIEDIKPEVEEAVITSNPFAKDDDSELDAIIKKYLEEAKEEMQAA